MTTGSILTVCDANICRSVAAGFLLTVGISDRPALSGIQVSTSGVSAVPGHHACRAIAHQLGAGEAWRQRAEEHRARLLDVDAIESADLILTATRGSRSAVVSLVPGARRRVFTLREALWLADGYRPSHSDTPLQDFVAYLDRNRGLRLLPERTQRLWRRQRHPFDIPDGHLRYWRAHQATLRQVQSTATKIVESMAPKTS